MSKTAKLIIIIMGFLLAISVCVVIATLGQKKSLEVVKQNIEQQLSQAEGREMKLLVEAKNFNAQLADAQSAKEKAQNELKAALPEINDLKNKIKTFSSERDEWTQKVEAIRKERDELMAKLEQGGMYTAAPQVDPAANAASQESQAAVVAPENEQYWAQILKEKASLELEITDLKNKLTASTVLTEELKKKNSDLGMELSSLQSEHGEVERKIKYGEDLSNNLSLELARAKNEHKFLNERTENFRQENIALKTQIKSLSGTKIALEKSIARLTEEKFSVERKLAETEGVIQNRIDEIWQIKEGLNKRFENAQSSNSQEVELSPIIVSAPGPVVNQPEGEDFPGGSSGMQGRVVSVNEDNNFVIVDMGEAAGIRLGDGLNVYRDAQLIAGLEVIQVRSDISAADIKQRSTKIQVGDSVR